MFQGSPCCLVSAQWLVSCSAVFYPDDFTAESVQAVEKEVAKNVKARQLSSVGETVKREDDMSMWRHWLKTYQVRLQVELANGKSPEDRLKAMNARNPTVVLRNWVAQSAIDAASAGSYHVVCALGWGDMYIYTAVCCQFRTWATDAT